MTGIDQPLPNLVHVVQNSRMHRRLVVVICSRQLENQESTLETTWKLSLVERGLFVVLGQPRQSEKQ